MASLVAYDDSDSETETEPTTSVNSEDQIDDASAMTRPSGMGFTSGTVDVTKEGAQHIGDSPSEDTGDRRLPLARIWRSPPGSCPSQRLQWPSEDPDTAFPVSEPPRPSWMSRAPAGHVPLAAACLKPVKAAWAALRSSSHAQSEVESTSGIASSSQRKRGTQVFSGRSDFRVTTLKFHPKDHNVFLCGGFSSEIKAWDMRTGKVVKGYKATIQQTLDILFLQEGSEFLSSTDASTRDSADRTIIAWDFRTAAKISNQIYHERYTCPSLALHPREPVFLAQTNGNYLALFSSVWPYRMSRRRRYEGHKVEGYAVGCECSPCGDLLVTGSADGRVLMFSFRTARRACTLQGHAQACLGTTYHPVLPSVLGTCSWGGDIKIWH